MAQNSLTGTHSEQLEIEEIDESKNVVAHLRLAITAAARGLTS
jgi:hypothetical protein